VAGYYKNITDQIANVSYQNFENTVNYTTPENRQYEDIIGYEITLRKMFGRWVTGFVNYDYMVRSYGEVGRAAYYEDPRLERIQGFENPVQNRPLPRPSLRANINFMTPPDFGPLFGDFNLSFLYSWREGSYFTWDPLGTDTLQNNLQWKPVSNLDMKLSKDISIGGYSFTLFMEVYNVLDVKQLNTGAFFNAGDRNDYYRSLHLPMYKDSLYQLAGFKGGDDEPGEFKSDDKPYIDMPNYNYMWGLNPRYITFGLTLNF
jgi:hypothetical protein